MIALHAGFSDDHLQLWGEMPGAAEAGARKRSGQKRGGPLPYDAGAEGLCTALRAAGGEFTVEKRHMEAGIVWLPAVDDQPVASSSLIAEPPSSHAKAMLRPWTVTVWRLSPEQAVELLCACVGKQMLAPGMVAGNDLMFWATALRFAGALVARQQFLPGVTEENDRCRACWKPVFTGPDADLLAKLAKAMPPACRALTRAADSPPETPALSVLSAFIEEIVDHLVRSSTSQGEASVVGALHNLRELAEAMAAEVELKALPHQVLEQS